MKLTSRKTLLALAISLTACTIALSMSLSVTSRMPNLEPDYLLYCWNTPVGEIGRRQTHLFSDLSEAFPALQPQLKALMRTEVFTPEQRQQLCSLVAEARHDMNLASSG
jgi:Spy/CpxP family protein refolding chaperone